MALETFLPTTWQRLSTKIVGMLLGYLMLALFAIGATLYLSWQLEGSSAAINETGSLRMHGYRLSMLLGRLANEAEQESLRTDTIRELNEIDATFTRLRKGDPQRPLFLPPTERIQEEFNHVAMRWKSSMRPLAETMLASEATARKAAWQNYPPQVESFVAQVNELVQSIENDSELRTTWLRSSQLALVALALGGTVVIILETAVETCQLSCKAGRVWVFGESEESPDG